MITERRNEEYKILNLISKSKCDADIDYFSKYHWHIKAFYRTNKFSWHKNN